MPEFLLEEIDCNLCKSSNYNQLFQKEGLNIVKCAECDLVFVNPRLDQNYLKDLYSKDYYTGEGFDTTINYDEVHTKGSANDLETEIDYNYRMDMITKYKQHGTLLDIGCAFGDFLDFAKERFDIYGVEISPYSGRIAKERFKNRIFNGTIEKANLSSDFFDVVTMIEVIEHLPNPINSLKEINRIMKLDGIVAIQTGDINSMIPRIKGGDWDYIRPKGHLYYFSRKTMRKMLRDNGFNVMEHSSTGKAPAKISSVLRLPEKRLKEYLPVLRKLCNVSSRFGITGSITMARKIKNLS
jgi:ubiquinone/menaquinone biosynthesis C-methylase UbiE